MPETWAKASAGSAAMARPAASFGGQTEFQAAQQTRSPKTCARGHQDAGELRRNHDADSEQPRGPARRHEKQAHSGLVDPVSSCPGLKANPCNAAKLRA
jgi:hypothetical protein